MAKVVRIRTKPTDYKAQHTVTYVAIDRSVGSQRMSIRYDIIPPRQRTDESPQARPTDCAIFIIKGQIRVYVDGEAKEEFDVGVGDFVFVPAGEPYYAENRSSTVSCEAIYAIPSPSFRE